MVEADERAKPALNKSGSTSTKRGAKTRFSSVSGHFVLQLSELTSTLASTNSHFVRCVNPNKSKMSNSIQGGHVLHQLRCSGMMEALRLMATHNLRHLPVRKPPTWLWRPGMGNLKEATVAPEPPALLGVVSMRELCKQLLVE